MAKLKSPIDDILKRSTPVEMPKIDWKAEHKKEVENYENWWKKEKKRIDNIKCPVCQSTKKENIEKTKSNNIIGPGYNSWVTEEYLVCGKCGVMYKDLKKPKNTLKYPKNIFY